MSLLLHLTDQDEAVWAERFRAALPGYRVLRRGDEYDPAEIEYIFVWKPAPDAFAGLTGLTAVLSLGAGVDALLTHPGLPPDVPIVRFVDDDLSQRMGDYVVAQVTMHHRLFTRYRADQRQRLWRQLYPPAASETTVGIMGTGAIGMRAIEMLRPLGFTLSSWSRTPRPLPGVAGHAGPGELDAFLGETDILVCLLPLTPETDGILNYDNFRKLRRRLEGGPVLVNAARGGHQREADIVRALSDGTLGAASLDVFETEPLPPESPLWALDNCYITPHIAAISSPQSGVSYFSRVIRDHAAGKPLPNVVDRERGY